MSATNPVLIACGGNYNLLTPQEQRAYWDWESDEAERERTRVHNAYIKRLRDERIEAKIASALAAKAVKDRASQHEGPGGRHVLRFRNRCEFERAAQAQAAAGFAKAGIQSQRRIDLQLFGHITTEIETEIVASLRAAPCAAEIFLLINSPGGKVIPAENIYAALTSHPAQRTAVVLQHCASAATTVLMSCQNRFAMPDSNFMLHKTVMPSPAHRNARAIGAASDQVELMIARESGLDLAKFKALVETGETGSCFGAYDACALGLLNGVIDPDADMEPFMPLIEAEASTAPIDSGEEIEIPETYEVMIRGNVVAFPLDVAKVQGILRGGCFGLPSAFMHAARRIAGLPP